jgi:hypothetical protein
VGRGSERRQARVVRWLAVFAVSAGVLSALTARRRTHELARLRRDDVRLERRLRRARAELFRVRLLLERGQPASVEAALAAVEAALDELPSIY